MKHWPKIIIGIALVLVITNPSQSDFKNRFGYGHRLYYFLFFSIYESTEQKYVGVFKNFIHLSSPVDEERKRQDDLMVINARAVYDKIRKDSIDAVARAIQDSIDRSNKAAYEMAIQDSIAMAIYEKNRSN